MAKATAGIKDVADRAGVSIGTVSHVLNYPDRVSKEKREAVLEAIDELGYIPSEAGRRLRQVKSQLVGVVVLDISNPFFVQAARAIENRLAEDNCFPMIVSSDGDDEKEATIMRLLAGQRVRGVIVTPSGHTLENLEILRNRGIPVVLMDHPPIDDAIPTVATDDRVGARLAIDHLVSLGHQNIGFISGPESIRQARDRSAGVDDAAAVAGNVAVVKYFGDRFNADTGAAGARALLDAHPDITALFGASDQLAIGIMRAVRERELDIPSDISIIGYDDIDITSELITPLTTIKQPLSEIGREAASLLLGDGEPEKHIVFDPTLVVRKSTAEPNRS